MKRSKKGRPMSLCPRCQKDTVDVKKMGGIICSQCRVIKRPNSDHICTPDHNGECTICDEPV